MSWPRLAGARRSNLRETAELGKRKATRRLKRSVLPAMIGDRSLWASKSRAYYPGPFIFAAPSFEMPINCRSYRQRRIFAAARIGVGSLLARKEAPGTTFRATTVRKIGVMF